MSRDVVFVKYNTSDKLSKEYFNFSTKYIYKCL